MKTVFVTLGRDPARDETRVFTVESFDQAFAKSIEKLNVKEEDVERFEAKVLERWISYDRNCAGLMADWQEGDFRLIRK